MLIFDLVIKYCQYSETLGAMINAFELSNKGKNPTPTIVLSYLKNYQVKQITDFFDEISSSNYTRLKAEHKDKLIHAFGYHKSSSYDQTDYIFHLLKEIAAVYVFYLNSYNAYKHGHRVWYGYDLHTRRTNSVFYIERESKSNNYSTDYVPLDDDIITKFIMPRSKDCQTLFELILKNNRSISTETR